MNTQRWRTLLIGLIVLVLVAGSGLDGIDEVYGDNTTQTSDLTAGNNAFAFDLYHAVKDNSDNLIFSPYSVSLALAMTYAGARGNTEAQMADTLYFALSQDDLHPAFKDLDADLPRSDGDSADERFRFNVANALWGQDSYPFRPEFTTLLSDNYGAGLQAVNFMGDPEAARVQINDWVSDQTEERIKDLLAPGMISAATRLVLTNAIYFKAAWLSKFQVEFTSDGAFTLLDGSPVTVPMMTQAEFYAYAAGEGYQAVVLPYDGERMAMVILLPDAGNFAAFEESLGADRFGEIVSGAEWKEIWLTVPRFEITADFSLGEALAALGMTDAFDPDRADFSGMADTPEQLFISAVIHKAFIKVDETGTEAAAATAVIAVATAAPMDPPIELRIDRPFIYAIYDQETGTILFLGRVLNPA